MDTARYIVAFLWLIFSPVMAIWFFIHPFVGFWRRVGPTLTYLTVSAPLIGAGAAFALARHSLLSVEFGTQPLLWLPALLSYGSAVFIGIQIRKQLTPRMVVGVPELARDQSHRRLVTGGIYARIRHPRYVAILLAMLGCALFSNYLALYLLVPIYAAVIYLVTLLEERELLAVFGAEYERYRERVPRFIPRQGGASPERHAP